MSFDSDTGVLRIDVGGGRKGSGDASDQPPVPSTEARPSEGTLGSIEVRDTGTARGCGAYVREGSDLPRHAFLGFYEGKTVRTRDELDRRVDERQRQGKGGGGSGYMDYVMSLDGGVTFIDGYDRAQERSTFSPVHLNHVDGDQTGCNCFRLLEGTQVAFFTSRPIESGEELCFNYGKNFWRGREQEKL